MSGLDDLAVLLGSEVRGDLLILFHRNPGLIDTIEGVARRIGRNASGIEDDIRELVKIGVLKLKQIGSSQVILLDRIRDHQIQESVSNNLKAVGGVAAQ